MNLHTERRLFLCANHPACPECFEKHQIQLKAYMHTGKAQWQCRTCKKKFEFEPALWIKSDTELELFRAAVKSGRKPHCMFHERYKEQVIEIAIKEDFTVFKTLEEGFLEIEWE